MDVEQNLLSHERYPSYTTHFHQPPKLYRLYEKWPGRNRFLCGGRLVLGANSGCLLFTTITLLLPPIIIALSRHHLEHSDIPFFGNNSLPFPYPFSSLYFTSLVTLAVFTLIGLFCTAASDPGILPRTPANCVTPAPLPGLTAELDGQPCSYCATCNFLRPPRTKHCRFCDNCVLEFDHHCPWTGTCVGQRNYRSFLTFLGIMLAYLIFLTITSLWGLYTHAQEYVSLSEEAFRDVLRENSHGSRMAEIESTGFLSRVSLAVHQRSCDIFILVYVLFLSLPLLPLISYHVTLLRQGQTTNEAVRRRFAVTARTNTSTSGSSRSSSGGGDGGSDIGAQGMGIVTTEEVRSPYNEGFWRNLYRACCRRPPAALDARVWVDDAGKPVLPSSVNREAAERHVANEWSSRAGAGLGVGAGSRAGGVGGVGVGAGSVGAGSADASLRVRHWADPLPAPLVAHAFSTAQSTSLTHYSDGFARNTDSYDGLCADMESAGAGTLDARELDYWEGQYAWYAVREEARRRAQAATTGKCAAL